MLGAVVGAIGTLISSWIPSKPAFIALGVVGVAIALREFRVVRFPMLQVPRQTAKHWRRHLSPASAAFAWGVDLGFGVTTFIRYGGLWILVLAGLISGNLIYSIVILGTFGAIRGSVVPVVSHFLNNSEGDGELLVDEVKWIRLRENWAHKMHGFSIMLPSTAIVVAGI